MDAVAGPLHAYLVGVGRDGRGRLAADVLAFSDEEIEAVHDFIQWLFPLPTRSMAQPQSPVLTPAEIEALLGDPRAAETLDRATERMLRFYRDTDGWLVSHDHNHLRISRIIQSLWILRGPEAAQAFLRAVEARNEAAGAPVNAGSRAYWARAAG